MSFHAEGTAGVLRNGEPLPEPAVRVVESKTDLAHARAILTAEAGHSSALRHGRRFARDMALDRLDWRLSSEVIRDWLERGDALGALLFPGQSPP